MANKAIDSLTFGSDNFTFTTPYGTCSTGSGDAAKVVTCPNFLSLETGAKIAVKFQYMNAVSNPTLNVNSTGAKAIYYRGAAVTTTNSIQSNDTLMFVYDGTNWVIEGQLDTTYIAATTSASGLMTSAMVTKLNGIATGANKYTHPSYTATTGVPTANQTPAFGGTFSVTQPVSDGSGHITAMNSRTITIPSTTATTSAAGLMSATDKKKVDWLVEQEVEEDDFSYYKFQPEGLNSCIKFDGECDALNLYGYDGLYLTVEGGSPAQLNGDALEGKKVVAASSSDGTAYTATVKNVTSLYTGLTITILPSRVSASTAPTLNINGLGAKTIRMPVGYNSNLNQALPVATCLQQGKPVKLTYNGTYWLTDMQLASATNLYGVVPISKGGTGASSVADAKTALGIPTFELDGTTLTITL